MILRIRNRNEVLWNRAPRDRNSEDNHPPPRNERQTRLSQALYDHPPRREDRIILEVGSGKS